MRWSSAASQVCHTLLPCQLICTCLLNRVGNRDFFFFFFLETQSIFINRYKAPNVFGIRCWIFNEMITEWPIVVMDVQGSAVIPAPARTATCACRIQLAEPRRPLAPGERCVSRCARRLQFAPVRIASI